MHGLGVKLLYRVFTEDSTTADKTGFLALTPRNPGLSAFFHRMLLQPRAFPLLCSVPVLSQGPLFLP